MCLHGPPRAFWIGRLRGSAVRLSANEHERCWRAGAVLKLPPQRPLSAMGLLGELVRGLVRGADRTAAWTSKRGPRTFHKGRGTKRLGFVISNGKFRLVPAMVPRLVVPDLSGFKLKPYVSYRAPAGSEPPLDARRLFRETVAGRIEQDVREGRYSPDQLEHYGFEPRQEGKLFQLFPKNFVR